MLLKIRIVQEKMNIEKYHHKNKNRKKKKINTKTRTIVELRQRTNK